MRCKKIQPEILNTLYFESPKRSSKKAKFGRSKEKRYDRKLLVLVNSPSKALTEESMNRQYRQRFEDMLAAIRKGLSTNRQLKTGLSLRPIYHQNDGTSDAHLYLGLLSYWIVNTIRYQLKEKGEKSYWTEIVRTMSTQKLVCSNATNALGEIVEMDICTQPTQAAAAIYDKLGFRYYPFRKMKICSVQT